MRAVEIRCRGAVDYSQGLTALISSLHYNPYDVKKGLGVSVVFLNSVSFSGTQIAAEKKQEELADLVLRVFRPLIREQSYRYNIIHYIKLDDGSLTSAVLNATTVLLVTQGVPLQHMVISVTVGTGLKKSTDYVADLTREEENMHPSIVLAVAATKHKDSVSLLLSSSPVPHALLLDILSWPPLIPALLKSTLAEMKKGIKEARDLDRAR